MRNSIFKIQYSKFFSEKGVALIWALFISAIVMILVTSMVMLVVKELRISSNIDESGRAYDAAESGMERMLYEKKLMTDENIDWTCNSDDSDKTKIHKDFPVSADPDKDDIIKADVSTAEQLRYEVSITCNSGQIAINSVGISRNSTKRELRTTSASIDPSTRIIDTFDNSDGLLNLSVQGWYFPAWRNPPYPNWSIPVPPPPTPDPAIIRQPIIVQQFDIKNLAKQNVNGNKSFIVGMKRPTGLLPPVVGEDEMGVEFSQGQGNNVKVKLMGPSFNFNNGNLESNGFEFAADKGETYQTRIEYSRQGSGNEGYTVSKVIILQLQIDPKGEQNSFRCINTDKGYADFYGRQGRVNTFPYVKITGESSWVDLNFNQYIETKGGVRIDNMVFWGRS